jgi:iron-sulfur cluster assembly protein
MEQALQAGNQGHTVEPLLTVTATAVAMMKQALARGCADGIRLTVDGGGCKGFQYRLSFEAAARTDDVVVVQDGVRFFLDPVSARHLQGTLLDYVSNRQGTGFHFFGLDAARTIGCGSSAVLRRCIAGNNRTIGCTNSAKRPLLEVSQQVSQTSMTGRSSVAHPGLQPLSLCPQCHYVRCRCEGAN